MKKPISAAISERRRTGQRGSALLIVFLMAAVIAIMLYKELPISAFEAQRQKEELLVMRGAEYKRGVKLFVRKFGRFPASLDELENTNRMRFLRRKYDDPLTGKDDWRLIHAGPGGVIMDSKVKNANSKTASTLGQGATFGGFNNSIVQADPDADTPAASSVAMRQRPAPTANAASLNSAVNGDFPPMPNTGGSPMPGAANSDPNASSNPNMMPGQGLANLPSSATGAAGLSSPPVNASPGNAAVAQQLNQQNPLTPQGQTNSAVQNTSAFPQNTTQQGQQALAAGGVAGVASKAPGKTIKLVNDQTKYALWEFYYDLAKEQSVTMPGAVQPNANGAGQNGVNSLNNSNNSNSAFGSGSSFGSSNSAFGSNQNSNGQNGSSTGIGTQFPNAPPASTSGNPPQE